jgi:hypothetical protein
MSYPEGPTPIYPFLEIRAAKRVVLIGHFWKEPCRATDELKRLASISFLATSVTPGTL